MREPDRSKNRHKSVDAEVSRHQPDDTTGNFASFASTQPFASCLPARENGITVFTPGEALPDALALRTLQGQQRKGKGDHRIPSGE